MRLGYGGIGRASVRRRFLLGGLAVICKHVGGESGGGKVGGMLLYRIWVANVGNALAQARGTLIRTAPMGTLQWAFWIYSGYTH